MHHLLVELVVAVTLRLEKIYYCTGHVWNNKNNEHIILVIQQCPAKKKSKSLCCLENMILIRHLISYYIVLFIGSICAGFAIIRSILFIITG